MVRLGWAVSLAEYSLPGDRYGQSELSYEFSGAFFARGQTRSE